MTTQVYGILTTTRRGLFNALHGAIERAPFAQREALYQALKNFENARDAHAMRKLNEHKMVNSLFTVLEESLYDFAMQEEMENVS